MKRITEIVKEKLVMMLQKDFQFDITDRIMVVSDLEHYKASVDPFVHAQKTEKIPKYYEVYWDNEWIMDFHEGDLPAAVYTQFLRGFADAYEAGKVRLNKSLAEAERQYDLDAMIKNMKVEKMKETIEDAFEIGGKGQNPESGEEAEMSKEIISEVKKEKKK